MRTFCPKCAKTREIDAESCNTCGTKLQQASSNSPLGIELDSKYFIVETLGRGGAGAVYRARQRSMGRDVAVKVLAPERIADEKAIARFKREARAVSQLSHPNIITVHDFGIAHGVHYLVMELIEGKSLADMVAPDRTMLLERAVTITAQICDALAEAHDQGVIHRDLKSHNVMVSARHGNADFVKVLDFGLVKIFGAEPSPALTTAGRIVGTPSYMSPEQIEGRQVDTRTDLYSAGVILFELLCGQPPFAADEPEATLLQQLSAPLPRLNDLNPAVMLPAAVDRFLARAMAREPERRPDTATDLKRELRELARIVDEQLNATVVDPHPAAAAKLPLIDPDEHELPTLPHIDPTAGRSRSAMRSAKALAPIQPDEIEDATEPVLEPFVSAPSGEETVRDPSLELPKPVVAPPDVVADEAQTDETPVELQAEPPVDAPVDIPPTDTADEETARLDPPKEVVRTTPVVRQPRPPEMQQAPPQRSYGLVVVLVVIAVALALALLPIEC